MKIIYFLFIPLSIFSQTNYTENDISAAAQHSDQWLLTNTVGEMDYIYGAMMMAQSFIYSKTLWQAKYSECGKNCHQWVHENSPVGNQRKRSISYKLYFDHLANGTPISKKVVFKGDSDLILDFFVSYWTTDIDLTNIPKGDNYVASTRFLSDVATLKIDKNGNTSIIVQTVADIHKTKLSYNED